MDAVADQLGGLREVCCGADNAGCAMQQRRHCIIQVGEMTGTGLKSRSGCSIVCVSMA